MQKSKTISNLEYYDRIAPEYNYQIGNNPANELVRLRVAQYFNRYVTGGKVLDFGGGTGLDLPWLLQNNRQVFFLEPSPGMRALAVKQVEHHPLKENITFFNDDEVNISAWLAGKFLPEQVDGCLANFAVLNSISNLEQVFEKLGLIVKPDGHFIGTVLDVRFKILFVRHFTSYLKSLFKKEITVYNTYRGSRQAVYMHFMKKVVECARPWFNIYKTIPLGGYGFTLIHFTRV